MKNSKKIIKIIFINFFIFIFTFMCIDMFFYTNIANYIKKTCVLEKKEYKPFPYFQKVSNFEENYQEIKTSQFRKPEGVTYKKKPIIIFGCSFAYGSGLSDNQTFGYKLSHFSKRPVYNRAFSGWGIQHMLYQIRKDSFYKEVREPEYVIYVFIDDHIRRMYLDIFDPSHKSIYLRYKEKKGKLIERKPLFPFLWCFYSVNQYQLVKACKINDKIENEDKNFNFMKKMLLESKREIDKKYPKEKFIIIKYGTHMEEPSWYIKTDRWKELEKEGFIVLDTNELTRKDLSSKKYCLEDNHPNEKAWDLIVPKLVEKLKL